MFFSLPLRRAGIAAGAILAAVIACNTPAPEPTQAPDPSTPVPTVVVPTTAPVQPTATEAEAAATAPAATATPEQAPMTPAPPPVVANADFEGMSFRYDLSYAAGWDVEIVPIGGSDPWALPSHYLFTLESYPIASSFHAPRLYVIPVRNFEGFDQRPLDTLRQLMEQRPTTLEEDLTPDSDGEALPFLPYFNAAQVFRAQIEFMAFQSGTGVRYITQYDQAPIPINNNELLYTFQGLTSDGNYYIAVTMPITHPALPNNDRDIPGGDPAAFAASFATYIDETSRMLNEADPADFHPDLTVLDALVQSIVINR